MSKKVPYRIYLSEEEMPKVWYNIRADMKEQPAPMLNPATLKPVTAEDLAPVFCDELVRQELDSTTRYFEIPGEILEFYRMFRPSPLIRGYNLEKALGTPAKIYYKFEGNNTSGSHKLNSAAAQVYYAKKQGLAGLTTETGAGQWGTALAEACAFFKIPLTVYMVKCSYEQKPFRRSVMETFGAEGSRQAIPQRPAGPSGERPGYRREPGLRHLRGGGKSGYNRRLPVCPGLRFEPGPITPVHYRPGNEKSHGND